MNKKVFVFDLDGTLLKSDNLLHPTTLKALEEKSKDSIIAIATGRSLTKSKHVFKQLPFLKYFFANNGNVIFDIQKDTVEVIDFLSVDLYKFAREFALENNLILQMDTDKNSYIVYDESKHDHLVDKQKLMDLNRDVISTIENCDTAVFDRNEKIVQLAIRDKLDTAASHFEIVKNQFGDQFEIVLTNRIYIDMNPVGVSKANAVKFLKQKYGDDIFVYAFGDSSNDIKLIEAANIGIALGNATDDLKEAADIVIGDHESSAIGDFLNDIK